MTKSTFVGICCSTVTACMVALAATPASAVTIFSSSGDPLDASLTVLGLLTVTVDPVNATGSGTTNYNKNGTLGHINTNVGLGLLGALGSFDAVSTGVLNANAKGNFGATPKVASGTSSINNLTGLSLNEILNLTPLFDISATTLASLSQVTDNAGDLERSGTSTITGLSIFVNGVAVTVDITGAPNQVLFDAGGLLIEANRQIDYGVNGTGSPLDGITTDALYIDFSNFALGTGILNGNVAVGQSFAFINTSPKPEPATWALMLTGIAGIGAALRGRRARKQIAA